MTFRTGAMDELDLSIGVFNDDAHMSGTAIGGIGSRKYQAIPFLTGAEVHFAS